MDMLKQNDLVVDTSKVMSRREKLLLWAGMIRAHRSPIALYHLLERNTPEQLRCIAVQSDHQTAFGIAVRAQEFGLSAPTNVDAVRGYFELTQAELHEFSCDCGGSISNEDMARSVERIAG